ncbi:MAG: SPFH domain-containing protein [Phycisphaerales bacterium]
MRNPFLIVIAALIVGGFLLYMCSFTVRFTDVAVVTTFGKAGENSVVETPGFKLKWPAPIQNVTVYDRRVRMMKTPPETQQTADDRQIAIETFLAYRVSDPLRFFRAFGVVGGSDTRQHYRQAEEALLSRLRSALAVVSSYRLNDLFTTQEGRSQIANLEADLLARLQAAESAEGAELRSETLESYGVEVILVGVSSIVLPEATTNVVFQRMTETRNTMAANAKTEGEAEALRIRSEAEAEAEVIEQFAQALAEDIRVRGSEESAQWLAQLNEDPELAEFLQEIEFITQGFARRVTLVMPATFLGLRLFDTNALETRMTEAQDRVTTRSVAQQEDGSDTPEERSAAGAGGNPR